MAFALTGDPKQILDTFKTHAGMAKFNARIFKSVANAGGHRDRLEYFQKLYDTTPHPSDGLRNNLALALKDEDLLLLDQIDIYTDALGINVISYFDKSLVLDILSATIVRRDELIVDIAGQIEFHELLNPDDEPIAHGEVTTSVILPFLHFSQNLAMLAKEREQIEARRLDLVRGVCIGRCENLEPSKLLAVKMYGVENHRWFYFEMKRDGMQIIKGPDFEATNDRGIAILTEVGYDVIMLGTQERLNPEDVLRSAAQHHFDEPLLGRDTGYRGIA